MARICPQCKRSTDEKTCPDCRMPTVDEAGIAGKDLVGRVFAERYEVEDVVGRGGMGTVYRARNTALGSQVALKVLRREAAEDLESIERFYREARAASQLRHVNSIKVFDFGQSEDGRLFLAMEYLEGRSLRGELNAVKRLDEGRALKIAEQVAKSLGEAHSLGIVHRDVKPENIFLTRMFQETDFVKVLDFGIARTMNSETLTRTGTAVGTPRYMSPEQGRAEKVDGRSDLYSLGVVMYEAVAGSPPFSADTPIGYVLCHVNDAPTPLREAVPGLVTPAFDRLVMAMLAKRPDDRPADAEDLLGRIAAVRRGDIPTVVAVPKAQATTAADEEAGTQPTPRAMPLPPGPAAPADAGRPPVTLSEIAAGTVRTPAARHAWAPPIVSGSEVDERHRGAWPFALTLSLLVLVGGAVFVATGPGFDATWKGIVGFASSPPSTAPAPAPAAAARPSTPTPAAVAGRARVVAARVTSVPRGARVTLANGAPIGTTPVEVLVTDGQPLTVRLSAAGHADSEVALEFAAVDAAPDHEVKVTLRPRR